jgi:glycosyltransferase involved in cell wall biosynthesis
MNKKEIKSLQIGMHWFPERPGGLDRVVQQLAATLPAAGVSVRGLVAGGDMAARDTGGAIRAFAPADGKLPGRLLAARRAVAECVRNDPPDVIASHFALYAFPSLDVLRRIPSVMHFHGPWSDESLAEGSGGLGNTLKRRLEAAVYGRGTLHVTLSRAFADVLETRYGVSPDTIRIVPGCVDVARFDLPISREEARARLDLPTDRPIILTVRRLARRMGLEDLIEAMVEVRKSVPDVLLGIVGGGGLADELKKRIVELGLDDNVKMMGRVSDDLLPLAYRAANVSIVPTVALEGFGLTTIESLAAGTPVLVTPVGGLPEAVGALAEDLVLPANGTRAIAYGLIGALRGRLRLPADPACRMYARAGFDVPLMASRTAAVYREAMAQFGRYVPARPARAT